MGCLWDHNMQGCCSSYVPEVNPCCLYVACVPTKHSLLSWVYSCLALDVCSCTFLPRKTGRIACRETLFLFQMDIGWVGSDKKNRWHHVVSLYSVFATCTCIPKGFSINIMGKWVEYWEDSKQFLSKITSGPANDFRGLQDWGRGIFPFLDWIVCWFVKSVFWHLEEINFNMCEFIISQCISSNL